MRLNPTLRTGLACVGSIALACAATGQEYGNGQDTAPPITDEQPLEVAEAKDAPTPKKISLYVGVNVVSQYISRGLAFSDKVSYQPWVEVYIPLPKDARPDWLDNWTVFLGNWNSFQSGGPGLGQPRNDGPVDNWYEADLYGGFTWTVIEKLSGSLAYYRYESPSDSFPGYNEIELKLNYDDSGMHDWAPLPGFGFHPAIRLTHEFDRPDEDGMYIQPSLTPSFVIEPVHDMPITLAVPLVVGLGQDFYSDAAGSDVTYGYFATGLKAGMPLHLLHDKSGGLTITGGVDVVFPHDRVANGLDDDAEIIGKIGITWAY